MASRSSTWRVPIALVALAIVPVVAGSLRLIELLGGAAVMPPNARFDASPVPVVTHIVTAIVFAVLGAFQFSTRIRRRRPAWHRRAGRVLVVAGLGVALSALWLNQFFPGRAPLARCCTHSGLCSVWRWCSPSSPGSSRPVVVTSRVTGPG